MSQAPPIPPGPPPTSITRELSPGCTVTVSKLRPRRSLRGLALMLRAFGPLIGRALTGAPMQIETSEGVVEVPVFQALAMILSSEDSDGPSSGLTSQVAGLALKHLETLNVNEIDNLVEVLLWNHLQINGQLVGTLADGAAPGEGLELLDVLLPDGIALAGCLKLAIQLNWHPTSLVANTEESSPAARTAGTSSES